MIKPLRIIVALLMMTSVVSVSKAQTVRNDYRFIESVVPYTPITGGSQLNGASDDDTFYGNVSLGFPFTYNNVQYTAIGISNNGFIAFHNYTTGNNGSGIGGRGTSGGTALYAFNNTNPAYRFGPVVAVFNMDLLSVSGQNSRLTTQTLGIAPNRRFIAQWANYTRYGNGSSNPDNLNFQIILSEADNSVKVHYGTMNFNSSATAGVAQIGLRGNDTTDVNNRFGASLTTTTQGTYAFEGVRINNPPVPSGLLFEWSTAPPAQFDASISAINRPLNITGSACIASVVDTVFFTARNLGSDSITVLPVAYSVNGGAPVREVFTLTSPLRRNTAITLRFSSSVTINAGDSLNFRVWAELPNEPQPNRRNDTASRSVTFKTSTGSQAIYPRWDTDFGGVASSTLPAGWFSENVAGTDRWSVESGLFDPGNSLSLPYAPRVGPAFLFFNSFNTSTRGTIARAASPCLDLTTWPSNEPVWVGFGMNADTDYPQFEDSVFVEIAAGGVNYRRVAGFSRYDFNVFGYTWRDYAVDISSYRGQLVRVAFTVKSAGGNNVGIDYATVRNAFPVALQRSLEQINVEAFPNPTTGTVNIKLPKGRYDEIVVLNGVGQVVKTVSNQVSELAGFEFDLSNLSTGTYQIRAKSGAAQYGARIVKQ